MKTSHIVFALLSLFALSSAAQARDLRPNDPIKLRGKVTMDGNKLLVGGLEVTAEGVKRKLSPLLGATVTVDAKINRVRVATRTEDGVVVGATPYATLKSVKIIDPVASEGYVEGVVRVNLGVATLDTGSEKYILTRVPAYAMAALDNHKVKIRGLVFEGEVKRLFVTGVEATVVRSGYLSGTDMRRDRDGSQDVSVGDKLQAKNIRIYNVKTKELKELTQERVPGDLLFVHLTRGQRSGWFPTSKLSFGELVGEPGGGIIGGIDSPGSGRSKTMQAIAAWWAGMVEERFEYAFEEATTDKERADLRELKEYESNFDAFVDVEQADLEDYWGFDSAEDAKANGYENWSVGWFSDIEGIGLGTYLLIDPATGEIVDESDIID